MNTSYSHYFLLGTIAITLCILPQFSFAAPPCNDIIDFDNNRTAISDCDNPFGPPSPAVTVSLSVDGTTVSEGDTVTVDDATNAVVSYETQPGFIESVILYKHDGDDYRATGSFFAPRLDGEGTYTFVVTESDTPILSQISPWEKAMNWLIPTAHAQFGPPGLSTVQAITFTVTEEVIEEIDPLLLQYAPILRMHEDESYYPMRMEDFVRDSALWNTELLDEVVFDEATLTPEVFKTFLESNSATEDYYLAYSDPQNAKSLDLNDAKAKYGAPDPEDVTIYAHKMTDSTDNREFVVLQYWQFYAMNNWNEVGEESNGEFTGLNNHEGDFETVFIFLDADTEKPKYIAYSAHHNDGDPNENPTQYESVRRSWTDDEVDRANDNVVSYVSLGSHANYPDNQNRFTGFGSNQDITSDEGEEIQSENFLTHFDEVLLTFGGKWGADSNFTLGGDGPEGPKFLILNAGGVARYLHPLEWAGIDDISEVIISEPTSEVDFPNSGVRMNFTELIAAGVEFEVTPYDEPITEGQTPENVVLLPRYWDIESSLVNESFETEVSFEYDEELVNELEGEEENLSVFFYNPDTDEWEPRTSFVSTTDNIVSFTSTTFSRYALGFAIPEKPKTLEELFTELREEIKASNLRKWQKKRLLVRINLAEKLIVKDSTKHYRLVDKLLFRSKNIITRYKKRSLIDDASKTLLFDLISDIQTEYQSLK